MYSDELINEVFGEVYNPGSPSIPPVDTPLSVHSEGDPFDDPVYSVFSEVYGEEEQPERYNILGGVKDVGKLAYDVPVNFVGAIASMFEDDNPEAEHDWKDIARKAQEERNRERMAEEGGEEYVLPWVQRKDIRQAGASTGFSGAAMGAAAMGGLVASPIPVPGSSVAAALAASGTAAYKMDKASFTQQIIDAARRNIPDITPDEVAKLVEDTKDIRTKHALWEAIPEAVGNVAQLAGIGTLFKAALGKKLGVRIFQTLAGMYGAEVSTEVITQMGQHNTEIEAGLAEGEKRKFTSLDDLHESLKEVGPQTFVLVSLTGGAGAVGAKTYELATTKLKGETAPIEEGVAESPAIDEIRTMFESGEFKQEDLEAIKEIWPEDVELVSAIDEILKPETAEIITPAPEPEKTDVALEEQGAGFRTPEERQEEIDREFTEEPTPKPEFSDEDLKGLSVNIEAMNEDGEVFSIEEDAKSALTDTENRIETFYKFLECLS